LKIVNQDEQSIKIGETFTLWFLIVGVISNIFGMLLALATNIADYVLLDKPYSVYQAIEHIRSNWYIETFAAIGITGLMIGLTLTVIFDNIKQRTAVFK
jgi:hypothetical protein